TCRARKINSSTHHTLASPSLMIAKGFLLTSLSRYSFSLKQKEDTFHEFNALARRRLAALAFHLRQSGTASRPWRRRHVFAGHAQPASLEEVGTAWPEDSDHRHLQPRRPEHQRRRRDR